ncbi:MAG: hypothetical protein IPG74_10450 [Flavobacteriales bacterium]|nr:hypothetical protein [Flavobacteriales bacterium]
MACATNNEGYDQPLPLLTQNTDYKLVVYNTGGIGTAGTFNVLLEHPAQNDAGISEILSPVGLVCSSVVFAEVELTNYGSAPLSSVDILYSVDLGAQQTFNWVGAVPLGYNESIVVQLPGVSVTQILHSFEATVANPNGQPDGIASNNGSTSSFDSNGESVTIEIVQDRFGAQTTWEIYDALEIAPIVSGGPMPTYPPTELFRTFRPIACLSSSATASRCEYLTRSATACAAHVVVGKYAASRGRAYR